MAKAKDKLKLSPRVKKFFAYLAKVNGKWEEDNEIRQRVSKNSSEAFCPITKAYHAKTKEYVHEGRASDTDVCKVVGITPAEAHAIMRAADDVPYHEDGVLDEAYGQQPQYYLINDPFTQEPKLVPNPDYDPNGGEITDPDILFHNALRVACGLDPLKLPDPPYAMNLNGDVFSSHKEAMSA